MQAATPDDLHWHCMKLIRDARRRAANKRLVISVTVCDLKRKYTAQRGLCMLSSVPLSIGKQSCNKSTSMSLDRIDSALGYTDENCQLLTTSVNTAKSTLSVVQFVGMCHDVVKTATLV